MDLDFSLAANDAETFAKPVRLEMSAAEWALEGAGAVMDCFFANAAETRASPVGWFWRRSCSSKIAAAISFALAWGDATLAVAALCMTAGLAAAVGLAAAGLNLAGFKKFAGRSETMVRSPVTGFILAYCMVSVDWFWFSFWRLRISDRICDKSADLSRSELGATPFCKNAVNMGFMGEIFGFINNILDAAGFDWIGKAAAERAVECSFC